MTDIGQIIRDETVIKILTDPTFINGDKPQMFLVGGAVRDFLATGATKHKDLDFSVTAKSYEHMKQWLVEAQGIEIFLETPQYGTIRGRFPKKAPDFAGLPVAGQAVDLVWARKDGVYSDGRHPDEVYPGTLYDDLSRRDATCNSVAVSVHGNIIDPFNGVQDIADRIFRAVGNPQDRIREDALRAFRALRFAITKGYKIDHDLDIVLRSRNIIEWCESISADRVRDELAKCYGFSTPLTNYYLVEKYPLLATVAFRDKGLKLVPTQKDHVR